MEGSTIEILRSARADRYHQKKGLKPNMKPQIRKRSGEVVPFDSAKIRSAVFKANIRLTEERLSPRQLDELTEQVSRKALEQFSVPTVEQIQDLVEEALMAHGYAQTAKAYILYRDEHKRVRELTPALMKTYENLTFRSNRDEQEIRGINEDTAMGTMLEYGSEGAKAFYDTNVIPPEVAEAHSTGKIHIHDKDFYALTSRRPSGLRKTISAPNSLANRRG